MASMRLVFRTSMYRHTRATVPLWQPFAHATLRPAPIHVTRHRSDRDDNRLLRQLPAGERASLLADAEYVRLPIGRRVARVGDPISTVYFPDSGVMSAVSEMATGHRLTISVTGAEGAIGLGAALGQRRYRLSHEVLVESRGHRLSAHRFAAAFDASPALRRIMLGHVSHRMAELMTSAACNRVHSHGQRLARWLLVSTDKAQQSWLPVTHDTLAQMVGGPRHAVTVALNELRALGAIAYLRGRVDVLDRSLLIAQACECYEMSTALYRQ
jgi:CRP-like cAMP-binding protein